MLMFEVVTFQMEQMNRGVWRQMFESTEFSIDMNIDSLG